MRNLGRILAIACATILLSSCVANRSYRRGDLYKNEFPASVDPIPAAVKDCSQLPEYECVDMPGGKEPEHLYLAHIEFDDMGELWSIGDLRAEPIAKPSQLENALAVIRNAQSEADQKQVPLVVITFVHGWHNNASERDEEKKNLGSFKTVLQTLSSRPSLKVANTPPVLVGVFLSWRGQSIAGDMAISYWGRRDAATRVGQTAVDSRIPHKSRRKEVG